MVTLWRLYFLLVCLVVLSDASPGEVGGDFLLAIRPRRQQQSPSQKPLLFSRALTLFGERRLSCPCFWNPAALCMKTRNNDIVILFPLPLFPKCGEKREFYVEKRFFPFFAIYGLFLLILTCLCSLFPSSLLSGIQADLSPPLGLN